jgi:phospholipase/carboxylesterase
MNGLDYSIKSLDGWILRIRKQTGSEMPPVLIALHGYTGDEHSMDVFTSRLPENYLVIAPRAPFLAKNGFSWVYKRSSGLPAYDDFSYAGGELTRRMKSWFEYLKITPVSIDLVGFSQGAAFCLFLINQYPAIFRLAAILSGFLPATSSTNPFIGNIIGKKIFVAHGLNDDTIAVAAAQSFIPLLEEAGAKVNFCEEEVGHKLGPICFNGLKEFFNAPGPGQTIPKTNLLPPTQ